MKRITTILFALFVVNTLALYACSPVFYSYYKKKGKIYYGPQFSRTSEYEVELVGVDTTSFSTDRISSHYYACDNKRVYYRGKPIEGIDVSTVQFLGGYPTLIGEDGYIKDKYSVYYLGNKVDSVDVNTFEAITSLYPLSGYGKDHIHVFHDGKVLACDPASFRLLQEGYSLDKNGLYFNDTLIEGANPDNYTQNSYFIFSNSNIFRNGKQLIGYDAESFEIMKIFSSGSSCGDYYYTGSLLRDKNGLYLNDEKIEGIDAQSFEMLNEGVSRDKNGYYTFSGYYDSNKGGSLFRFNKLPLDPHTTKTDTITLHRNYLFLKDAHNLFLADGSDIRNMTERIKVDAATFKPYARAKSAMIFYDKYRFYNLDWLTLSETYMENTGNTEIVYIDESDINIKNGKMFLKANLNSGTSDKDVDILTYNYAVDCDLGETDDNGEKITQYVFDKKNIYYGFSTSVYGTITPEEYEILKKHIIPQDKLEEKRKKSLQREYNF